MKKAWQDPIGTIRDICDSDPTLSYHPDIAKFYSTDVPNTTVNGATLVAGKWINPLPPAPPLPPEPPVFDLVSGIKSAILKIDTETDSIYGSVLGNRAEEYTLAADSADAFKAAGYTGTVPSSVQSWATAKKWTPKQATDDILSTRDSWVTAQEAIRASRLLRKEQIKSATNEADINKALSGWYVFVALIKTQLNID